MQQFFLLLLLAISILDIYKHKIHNLSLLVLILIGIFAGLNHFHFAHLFFSFGFAILLMMMRAGGGDIKFAILILPIFLPPDSLGRYLIAFSIIAACQLLIQGTYLYFFRRISLKSQHLALAPALAGALALVIR